MTEAIKTNIENLNGVIVPDEIVDEADSNPVSCPIATIYHDKTGFFPFVLTSCTYVFATDADRQQYVKLSQPVEGEPLIDPYKHPEQYGLDTMIDEVSHGDYLQAWILAHDDGVGFQIRLAVDEKGEINLDTEYGEEQALWDLHEHYGDVVYLDD